MAQNPNRPALAAQIAFNADPNDPAVAPVWTEIGQTNKVLSLSTQRGRQYELDTNQAGTASLRLDNQNEYLNPANASSPYHPNVVPYRQFRAFAAWPLTGNILNAANGWDPEVASGSGGWLGAAASGTHVRSGANAALVTWATGAAGAFMARLIVSKLQPGTRYAFSVYVYVPAGSPAVTIKDPLNEAATVSTQTSAVTGAFTRLVYVFDATLETHSLGIVTAAASTAGQQVWIDDYMLNFGPAAETFTTTGPVFYGLHAGYVERWPLAWESAGFRGVVDTTSVDAMAVLANQSLSTEYRSAVLATAPDYYWPLDEPDGAESFAEASGNNGPPLVRRDLKDGTGSVLAGQEATLAGDPGGTSVLFNNPPPAGVYSAAGSGLQAGALPSTPGVDVAADSGAWQVTVALWYRGSAVPTLAERKIFALTGKSQYGSAKHALRMVDSSAPGTLTMLDERNPAGSNLNVQTGWTTVVWDGIEHLIIGSVSVTAGGSCTVSHWVDDSTAHTTTTAIGTTPKMRSTIVEVAANTAGLSGETGYYVSDVSLSHIAVWKRLLTADERAALYEAGRGHAGELSGERITRYLGYGYSGPSQVDTGLSTMGVSDLAGDTSLLDALQSVAVSENGNLFVDGDGVVSAHDRSRRYLSTASVWTFGDGPGELPYEGDIAFGYDPTYIHNDVSIDRPGGGTAHVTDDASQKRYFRRELSRTHNVATDNEAVDAANWYLQRGKDPHLRVSQLTLEPGTNPALWEAALSTEIGTRVTVNRRTAAGVVLSGQFFVETVAHDVTDRGWTTSFQISPATTESVWLLGDAVNGVLDSTTRLAY